MLFGKNKELREKVDEWIDKKQFFHKMLNLNDEQKAIIIEKILTKDEKENFIECSKCYEKILDSVEDEYDDKKIINCIKEELSNNTHLSRTNRKSIYYELIEQDAIEPICLKEMDLFLDNPTNNNFDVEEALNNRKNKDINKDDDDIEDEELDEDDDDTEDEEPDEDDDDTENEEFDEDDDDTENEEFDEDDDDVENEEFDEDDDDVENEDLNEDNDDTENEEFEDDTEDEDIESEDEKSLDAVEDIYDALEYEKYNTTFDYHSSRIENKLKEFLEEKDFDSIDGFTKGFLMFPFKFFESIFVCVQYYAAKTFIDRVEFLQVFLEEALDNYNDKDIQKYIKTSLDELNNSQEELDGCRQLCDNCEAKAMKEEDLLKSKTKQIYETWVEKNPYDDKDDIKNILIIYKNYCLHYQSFDIKGLLFELLAKYYPLSQNDTLEQNMTMLNNQKFACACSSILLDSLFSNRKLPNELEVKIQDIKDALNDLISNTNELLDRYQEKMAAIKQRQQERAAMIQKQQELDTARQQVLERQEMQEQVAKAQRKNKQSKLRRFINFIDKLNNIGTTQSSRDINDSLIKISQYLMDRNAYPIGHGGRDGPTERINKEKFKIRQMLNNLTEADLEKLHFAWGNILEDETGIRAFDANLHKLTALQAILDI